MVADSSEFDHTRMDFVLNEVAVERESQHAKWGEQNHLDGTAQDGAAFEAKAAIARCEGAFEDGRGTWRHILEEEFYEARAQDDLRKLRHELIQVAAVAVAWVEDIDRRLAARLAA